MIVGEHLANIFQFPAIVFFVQPTGFLCRSRLSCKARAEAQQNAACNAVHDGSSRLCRWLLHCADRTGSDQLLLTQDFLAGMLGIRRTTVTLLAQEVQKRGVVRYGRGRITILDRRGMEACACECYQAVKKLSLKAGS